MSNIYKVLKKNQRKIGLYFKAKEYGLDSEKYKRWLGLKFVKPFDVDEFNKDRDYEK